MIKQPQTREEAKAWAEDLFKSGFCHDCENTEQVLYKILYGMELGVGVMASINGIYIQENKKKDKETGRVLQTIRKPTLTAPLMSTVIQKSGVFELRTKTFSNDLSEIEIRKNGETVRVSSFSKQDAAVAGLLSGANSYNYQKYARNMFHHRNISNIAKTDCAECFGGQPVYTPEEIGMAVDEDGIPVKDETSGEFTCDMRTYINEELADRGMPSIEESKAKVKAEKAAAKHEKAQAKAAEAAAPKSEPVRASAASNLDAEAPAGATASATSSPEAAPAGDNIVRPGRSHVAQLVQIGLDCGVPKEKVNEILQGYLTESGLCQTVEDLQNFIERWTMMDYQNIVDLVKKAAAKKAA